MSKTPEGFDLYFEVHGRGRPTLVMHGGLGWDHTYFRPGLDALGERLQLVYYDHRGNGRSERPADWSQVSHQTWVDDADRLREHLGHDRVVVFGHSYGGFLAQEYALSHPERVEALILCCTAPALDYPDVLMANAQARGTPDSLQGLMEAFSGPLADDEALARITAAILPLYFHQPNAERTAAIARQIRCSAGAFNRSTFGCAPLFDTRARLAEIGVPTLILAGRDDWVTPVAQGAERIRQALPRSEMVVFERSGHFPFVEEPDSFARVIGDWIDRLN